PGTDTALGSSPPLRLGPARFPLPRSGCNERPPWDTVRRFDARHGWPAIVDSSFAVPDWRGFVALESRTPPQAASVRAGSAAITSKLQEAYPAWFGWRTLRHLVHLLRSVLH